MTKSLTSKTDDKKIIVLSLFAISAMVGLTMTAYAAEDIITSGTDESYIPVQDANSGTVFPDSIWDPVGTMAVNHTNNGQPSVFDTNIDARDKKITAFVNVTTIDDDDYIGFVLGYNLGDNQSAAADYLLIDWKQVQQDFDFTNATDHNNCVGLVSADEGLALSRVLGVPDPDEFWTHDDLGCGEIGFVDGNVTEIARNGTDQGWADQTEYKFDFILSGNTILAYLDDVLIFNETNTDYSTIEGNFGFYDFSQPQAVFGNVELMDEGCSPGFWKTDALKTKFNAEQWSDTGYDKGDKFDTIFGTDIDPLKGKGYDTNIDDPSLIQALNTRGEDHNALARQAVAALLNANDPNVNYPLTEAQVIDIVSNALSGTEEDINNAYAFLKGLNESGCPLEHIRN